MKKFQSSFNRTEQATNFEIINGPEFDQPHRKPELKKKIN